MKKSCRINCLRLVYNFDKIYPNKKYFMNYFWIRTLKYYTYIKNDKHIYASSKKIFLAYKIIHIYIHVDVCMYGYRQKMICLSNLLDSHMFAREINVTLLGHSIVYLLFPILPPILPFFPPSSVPYFLLSFLCLSELWL